MNLPKNLKKLRAKRKLSQFLVAKRNGLTRSTYSGYENGVAEPSLRTLIKLSKFFDVTLDKLIR